MGGCLQGGGEDHGEKIGKAGAYKLNGVQKAPELLVPQVLTKEVGV